MIKYSNTKQIMQMFRHDSADKSIAHQVIRQNLDKIQDFLGYSLTGLHAMDMSHIDRKFLDKNFNNVECYKWGHNGLPFISNAYFSSEFGDNVRGHYGCRACHCLNNKGLKYVEVHYCDCDESYISYVLICKKEDLWKILLHNARKNKDLDKKDKGIMPVFEKGFEDKIILETVDFLKNANRYVDYGAKPRRGIILTGEPGNGKTMFCKYLESIFKAKGYSTGRVTSTDIQNAHENNALEKLFNKEVLFFDDIDISFFDRSTSSGIGCALLGAMDGMAKQSKALRIFTTNETTSKLDKAFLRPGRIDSVVHFVSPDKKLRKKFLLSWDARLTKGLDLDIIVKKTEGFSFADMEQIKTEVVTFLINDNEIILDTILKNINEKKADKNFKDKGMGFG